MSTKFSSPIGRILLATALPAAMIFGSAQCALADSAPTTAPVFQDQPIRVYTGTDSGTPISLRIDSASGDDITGLLVIGNTQYAFIAGFDGLSYRGTFKVGSRVCFICATIVDNLVHLDLNGRTDIVLQLQS